MAFVAQHGTRTEELVTAITGTSPKVTPPPLALHSLSSRFAKCLPQTDRQKFGVYRESSLRALRHHSFLRTNQFEVEERLDGFQERFSVMGRDRLADALCQRRAALSRCSTIVTPDILHFLLEISDRPVSKSRLSDLDLLREPESDPGPPLKWEDIAREDGWASERFLWTNVDFGDSSDDAAHGETATDEDSGSDESSVSSMDAPAKALVRPSHLSGLWEDAQQNQAWRQRLTSADAKGPLQRLPISEMHVIRETLFMLQGLETSLFDSKYAPVLSYQMPGISWDTYKTLMDSAGQFGRQLGPLRRMLRRSLEVPLLQVFQDCIRRGLRQLDQQLVGIQSRFVAIKKDAVVSLLAVLEELKPPMSILRSLSAIVQRLQEERHAHAFRYLELLFDETCLAGLEGCDTVYRFLGSAFFDCFRVYLRPIRSWVEEGELIPGDKIFFVSEAGHKVPLNQIWQHQFKLRRTGEGRLHAPKFLQPAASKIFTTGKSIVVLKHLRNFQSGEKGGREEPGLDFDSVCLPGLELAPFAELFGNAFEAWIQSKHHPASATLQRTLFDSCGLWTSLDALHFVYLMADGAVADAFLHPIFNNLDASNPSWQDQFTLTEAAQEAFVSCVDSYRLSAVIRVDRNSVGGAHARTSLRNGISRIQLNYRLPWPVQLIITPETVAEYRPVFTLLMQIRRASSLLNRHRLLDDIPRADSGKEQDRYYYLRTKLIWFCTTLHAYLTSLVLAPRVAKLHRELRKAGDVDAMIAVHSRFVHSLNQEACLGRKLDPIRDAILDLLDLAVLLEDSRHANARKEAEELREISRLSDLQSPRKPEAGKLPSSRRGVYVSPAEEEEEAETTTILGDETNETSAPHVTATYNGILRGINSDYERHLRFITEGLRGVSRASNDPAAAKWDMLAEMLTTGLRSVG